jgi:putative DNA methylase
VKAADLPKPDSYPEGELFDWPGRINVVRYGLTEFHMLFTNRQLTALTMFSDLVGEARSKVESDALAAGLAPTDAPAYATGIATYLAFGLSKYSDYGCSFAVWYPQRSAEVVADSLFGLRPSAPGDAVAADARSQFARGGVIATDPPYYDNIGYADLSEFFYIWLRRTLGETYPELFWTMVTPKSTELIATPYRHAGSKAAAEKYFEDGFVEVFANMRSVARDSHPLTFFYAFKQAEAADELASTGWATMLESLGTAGWAVTATWPMRTERTARAISLGTNSLASSVVLACRPRPETAGVTDRQGLIRALRAELPGPLHELQKAHIAPVDLRQAAIGPGMAVFSRFARVIEPDGSTKRVRTALGLLNQVLDQVLDEQEQDFDSETRWAIHWFAQFYEDKGPYGVAEQLAVSMNVAVSKMVEAGIIRSGGGKVRLLGRDELPDGWDPVTDTRTPVWEATQHLVKRLVTDSESSAARLLRRLGGLGESAQLLAYRLYTVCERSRPGMAGPYNALIASWPEIQRLASEATAPVTVAEQQSFAT